MNILVLFSYGSLTNIDEVEGFYDDIFHGHATEEHINAGVKQYESISMADPLGGNTNRIGRSLTKQLMEETGERWEVFIANHHTLPSIETVAKKCIQLNPARVVTFGLTPFDSITGNSAYERKFRKVFRAENNITKLIHIPPYCENDQFVHVLTDRAMTAYHWLPKAVKSDTEIIFTVHSMPGLPNAHQKMIRQYEVLAQKVATALQVKAYHLAYRSGQPGQRWLEPDVLDVVSELSKRDVPAVLFIEALSVIENLEVIQEITRDAVEKARRYGMKAVQSEYLNDSSDFVAALSDHIFKEIRY